MAQKQYVGNGKAFGDYGCIKFGLKVSDLIPNDKGYVNLVIGPKREPDQWGKTHSVWVDDWKPTQPANGVHGFGEAPIPQPTTPLTQPVEDDLPF